MSALADLPKVASGKVREIYAGPDRTLLLVASDRISTYDVVHPTGIPDKGRVLTGLSAFWFEQTSSIVPNHVVSVTDRVPDEVRGRAMLVRRLEMLPVECVVRGYITGSGWKDYQSTGAVSGIELPPGLRESDKLPQPLFTPSTKAEVGHDEAIDFEGAASLIGDRALAERVRDVSIALYEHAAAHALERGIILADTKFELGLDENGELVIGDELCTPDSSRFWPADEYEPGRGQSSFDKQFVRDWASSTGWDRSPQRPRSPTTWWLARARSTSRPTSASQASLLRSGSRARGPPRGPDAGARPGQAQAGHPRSPGPGSGAGPPGTRLCRRSQRPHRAADRARRRGSRPAAGDLRAATGQSAGRGLRDRGGRRLGPNGAGS